MHGQVQVNLRRRWKHRRCTVGKQSHEFCWCRPRSEQWWPARTPDLYKRRDTLQRYCSNGGLAVLVRRWSRRGKTSECSVSFSSTWVFFFPAHWHLLLLHFLWFLKWSLIGSRGKALLLYILWWMFSVRPRGVCGGWRGAKTRQSGYFTCLWSCCGSQTEAAWASCQGTATHCSLMPKTMLPEVALRV